MPKIRESKAKVPHASQVNEDSTVVWQPHTEIVLKHGGVKSMKIDLKPQNADVQQLIHDSYPIGDQLLVFGHDDQPLKFSHLKIMETPMQKECVDKIAFKALVKAADKLQFDGEGDFADRLERGSYDRYAKPLLTYASVLIVSTLGSDMY